MKFDQQHSNKCNICIHFFCLDTISDSHIVIIMNLARRSICKLIRQIHPISYEGYKSPQKQARILYTSLLGRIICYFLVKAHLPPYHNRSTSFILLQIKVCRYFLHSLLNTKFCKRSFQGYSSKLNKSREKVFV